MNTPSLALCAALAALVSTSSLAADAFPKQPKMSAAYRKLNAALDQLEKKEAGDPASRNKKAIEELATAKNWLESADKDKGSYRPSAMRLIDQATLELQATPEDEKHTAAAIDFIKKAIDKIKQGVRAGRD